MTIKTPEQIAAEITEVWTRLDGELREDVSEAIVEGIEADRAHRQRYGGGVMKSSSEIAELVTRRTMPTVLNVLEGKGFQITTDLDSTIRRALKGAAYQGAEEARLAALTEKENAR